MKKGKNSFVLYKMFEVFSLLSIKEISLNNHISPKKFRHLTIKIKIIRDVAPLFTIKWLLFSTVCAIASAFRSCRIVTIKRRHMCIGFCHRVVLTIIYSVGALSTLSLTCPEQYDAAAETSIVLCKYRRFVQSSPATACVRTKKRIIKRSNRR